MFITVMLLAVYEEHSTSSLGKMKMGNPPMF